MKKIGKEITDTNLKKINGGHSNIFNNFSLLKNTFDFGKWTADRVFGDLMGWKKR